MGGSWLSRILASKTTAYAHTELPVTQVQDLVPLHGADLVASRLSALQQLSDEELLNTVRSPANGDYLTINMQTERVIQGNARAYELISRAGNPMSSIAPTTEIPYVPHYPDNSMFWDLP